MSTEYPELCGECRQSLIDHVEANPGLQGASVYCERGVLGMVSIDHGEIERWTVIGPIDPRQAEEMMQMATQQLKLAQAEPGPKAVWN